MSSSRISMSIKVDFKCMMILESRMAKLYHFLASKTDPQYRAFWEELRQAELNHITLLNELYKEFLKGNIQLRDNHFRAQAINTSRQFVNDKMQYLREHKVTMKQALEIAYAAEHSTLDGVMLKMFDDEEESVRDTFAVLERETALHRKTIEEMKENYQEPSLFEKILDKLRKNL